MSLLASPRLSTALCPLILFLSACVGTTTQPAPLPTGAGKAEEEKERVLALQANEGEQTRLDDIAYPILTMGTPLCPDDQRGHLGLRVATIHNYESEWRPAAARAFGLGDTLTVLSVTYGAPAAMAGLRPGDRIVAVDGASIKPGKESIKEFTALVEGNKKRGNREVAVALYRDGQQRRARIRPNETCDYGSVVIQSRELNAFADGDMIFVTSSMMRLLSNDELRVVIAHEFAHNALGHIKAEKKGAKAGAIVFSQDVEREADYLGLYALTLADLSVDAAPSFWRHMAQSDPKSTDFVHTHPPTAERFVRMEQAIAEIRQKAASRQALLPDRRPMREPLEPSLATTKPAADTGLAEPRAASAGMAASPLTQSTTPTPASTVTYSGEASPSSKTTPAKATQAQRSNAPRRGSSEDLVVGRPRLKAAIDDLIRLGMVTEYQEIRPGLLHLTVGKGFTEQSAIEFQLSLLDEAYREVSGGGATFLLFRKGVKIGQYGKEGLTLMAGH